MLHITDLSVQMDLSASHSCNHLTVLSSPVSMLVEKLHEVNHYTLLKNGDQ